MIGFLLQKYLITRVAKGLPSLLLTFGLSTALINLALVIFSADIRIVSPIYAGLSLAIGNVRISYARIVIFVSALIMMGSLNIFLMKTETGKAIRATAEDKDAALLMGIDTQWIYMLTMGLCVALAGVAGCLISVIQAFNPNLGAGFIGKAFVITILGGAGSIPGTFVAGLTLGLVESIVPSTVSEAVSFIVLVLILIVKPTGIFGRRS